MFFGTSRVRPSISVKLRVADVAVAVTVSVTFLVTVAVFVAVAVTVSTLAEQAVRASKKRAETTTAPPAFRKSRLVN
jgi:hypothetical protein